MSSLLLLSGFCLFASVSFFGFSLFYLRSESFPFEFVSIALFSVFVFSFFFWLAL